VALAADSLMSFAMHFATSAHSEDDDNFDTSRYEWKTTITRKMLSIVEEKKTASDKDFILTEKLWADVAKCMAKDISISFQRIQFVSTLSGTCS
jgi:hypothetical protein